MEVKVNPVALFDMFLRIKFDFKESNKRNKTIGSFRLQMSKSVYFSTIHIRIDTPDTRLINIIFK